MNKSTQLWQMGFIVKIEENLQAKFKIALHDELQQLRVDTKVETQQMISKLRNEIRHGVKL